MRSRPELLDQVALVTGGSRGIGAAIAVVLARSGANVAFTFASNGARAEAVSKQITQLGRKALAFQADSADPDAVTAAVERTVEHFGRLDILVNNAGVGDGGAFADVSRADFDRLFAIHARAPFFAAQAAARHMLNGGRIISIGTNLSTRVAEPGLALYVSSKSALIGMTRALARELGPQGITVNTVDPGSTDTEMNPADSPYASEQLKHNALGRFGAAEDVAAAVLHLAGPGGRSITGSSILVDSGFNA
ncbi:SDR family NAD(P)-dependent oxidoreductase [Devosia ginsengisoli]|uniref:SDR family NAD(P)-dependent oxidoreductase n=1 Tax=Devosia ginsengisoli TaxID=400770 RepID=UPI0026EDBFE2|nr:SDR family oxidoreductase [Devosia ginsengisoli]MCR6672225.1 SDR family oxidoreductase [Devosia ginsengisoli]